MLVNSFWETNYQFWSIKLYIETVLIILDMLIPHNMAGSIIQFQSCKKIKII